MARRGVALMDAIVGGVMLGIGLAVMLSLASRAVSLQGEGQRQLTAAWLVDELLSMVVVEGPVFYPQLHPTEGAFDEPFEDYEYTVDIEDIAIGKPYRVTASVRWAHGSEWREVTAQTYIAERLGSPFQIREPVEPIDRIGRYYDDDL